MIWLIAYLAVGLGFALYMPIKQARARARLDAMTPGEVASMDDGDRKILNAAADAIRTDYSALHIVIGGLLWPVSVLGVVVVEIVFAFRRS